MNKLILTLLGAFFIGAISTTAQTIIPDPDSTAIADHKMPASYNDTSQTWTYYFTDYGDETINEMSWSVKGDLKIISSTDTSVTVSSYTSRANNKDFAKGRIYAYYVLDEEIECGTLSQYYDIYKTFNDTTIELIGQDCAKLDEQVTYSIETLVSYNINAEIGIDSYYWTYDESLIGELLYFSGDSSSITFIAGSIPDEGASLSVTIGQKNSSLGYSTYTNNILKGVNEPSFISGYEPDTCMSIIADNIADTLIINAQDGILYEWDMGIYNTEYTSTNGDTIIYTPNEASETINLTVAGGCETLFYEYEINRSLNPDYTDIIISSETTPYCLNSETPYELELSNVSSSEKIEWNIDGDWTEIALMNTTTPNIQTGDYKAIITANTAACPSITVTDTFTIKPQTPDAITGNTCTSSYADTCIYSTTAQASADSYTWEYPTGWSIIGDSTENTISFATDGSTGALKVKANGCENTEWYSTEVSVAATKPVISSEPSCLNTHITTTFGIGINAEADDTYTWILPSCLTWEDISDNNDSITVSTNTFDIIDDSILVYASTACGNSDTTAIYINNSEDDMYLDFSSFVAEWFGKPAYTLNNPPSSYETDCYLIQNSGVSSISVISMGNNTFQLDTTNTTDLLANKSGWLLVLDITGDACTTRIIYGDTDYYTYSEINDILNSSSTTKSATISDSSEELVNSVLAYPNPVSNKVTLELEEKTDLTKEFLIYDITGKLIYQEESNSNKLKINTQSWMSGCYLVGIKTNGKVYKSTLIKK